VRRAFATRALILLLCVALLALLAQDPTASQFVAALIPWVIVFALLAAWNATPQRDPRRRGQPLSFLWLDTSRAPPTA
jgi:uncharacterized membrane protein (GlpM family)